jgi:hypothetical protein
MMQTQILVNPRKKYTDLTGFGAKIKSWFKNYNFSLHNNIILPRKYDNNGNLLVGGLILGAIPTKDTLRRLKKHFPNLVRVSLLTFEEESWMGYEKNNNISTISIPLFDHGVISAIDGKNIAYNEFKQKLDDIAVAMCDGKDIYIHCMAGKGRSFISVILLLYFHPELLENEAVNSKPLTIKELVEFVRKKRPIAKKLHKLEGDQAGFLGLAALRRISDLITSNDTLTAKELRQMTQDVSFVLGIPFDRGYRNETDLKQQKDSFKRLYVAYNRITKQDLLIFILLNKNNLTYDYYNGLKTEEIIFDLFNKLKINEQAHFAILTKEAQEAAKETQTTCDNKHSTISFIPAIRFAQLAVQNSLRSGIKLTIGDQVELLREFGEECGLNFADSIKNIVEDNRPWYKKLFRIGARERNFNIHHANIQLYELYSFKI